MSKAWYTERDFNTKEPKMTAQMFFTVYYAEKGDKMLHHFQGKIDIGSGNGGIISQLKMQNEMKLTDESWISYQQGKGNEEYQKYMEDLTDMQNHVPCDSSGNEYRKEASEADRHAELCASVSAELLQSGRKRCAGETRTAGSREK